MANNYLCLVLIALCSICHGFVDFGVLTQVKILPTAIPQTLQVPGEWQKKPRSLQDLTITAVAPILTSDDKGVYGFSWSTQYHHYSRHFQNARGIFKRQNGVFQSDASLLATCTPCGSGLIGNQTVSNANTDTLCYGSDYRGALYRVSTSTTGLPCCASCTPVQNNNTIITTGVLASTTGIVTTTTTTTISVLATSSSTNTTIVTTSTLVSSTQTGTTTTSSSIPTTSSSSSINTTTTATSVLATSSTLSTTSATSAISANSTNTDTTTITQITSATVTVTITSAGTTITETVVSQTSTVSQVTLSVATITPTVTNTTDSTTTTTTPATAVGCGTASGSGTIIGTGTVYLGPGISVTSVGTVSGYAPKVVGCGTIIAATGSFEGSATITGCGTGYGCAVFTGSGVVYPTALGGFIGITSSGTASGCGKLVGCGTLTGSGTFLITGPYTTTIPPPPPRSTVNIYISYCPPAAPFPPFNLINTTDNNGQYLPDNNTWPLSAPRLNTTSLPRIGNFSSSNNTFTNPLCQTCPNDSGICCPLYAACGADGHCPYTALVGAGYIHQGVNVVDDGNSSTGIGMVRVEGRVAPGFPGLSGSEGKAVVRRKLARRVHAHGHVVGAGVGRIRL